MTIGRVARISSRQKRLFISSHQAVAYAPFCSDGAVQFERCQLGPQPAHVDVEGVLVEILAALPELLQ